MRMLAALVCFASIALPLSARNAGPRTLETKMISSGQTARETLARQLGESRASSVTASAIIDNRSARIIAIPAAGSVRGLNNTFFRSDITFVNYNVNDQDVDVYWLPNGGGTPTRFEIELPGDVLPFTVPDFVGNVLNLQNQLGSLLFIPVDSAGNFDSDAAIDAYSRIWTPQPNASGTVSQPFPAIDPDHMIGHYEGVILGLRQDADYRTNVGIANYSLQTLDFVITVFPDSGSTFVEIPVRLPSLGYVQQPLPAGAFGPLTVTVSIEGDPGQDFNENAAWTAYASSTDNRTGDGWVSVASKGLDDELLDEGGL